MGEEQTGGWMEARMNGGIDGCLDRWMDGGIGGWMGVCGQVD